ncbi:hypothetical protein DL767_010269 [Monosporascus sp. MG133]|nr:hypothetical protein DL767_010269 [Monosporascus sp. MG133]
MEKDLYTMTDVSSQTLFLQNESVEAYADHSFGRRIRALQGVDEVIEDVINKLDEKGFLDNTYITFTRDNGYYIGNHRIPAEKALSMLKVQTCPSWFAVPVSQEARRPRFPRLLHSGAIPIPLTGQSSGGGKRTLDVEFWGLCIVEAPNVPALGVLFRTNNYKTLRNVGEDESWLYSRWCTGETQHDLSRHEVMRREHLPATTGAPLRGRRKDGIVSLKRAMHRKYDKLFAQFPEVAFKKCIMYQDIGNEKPFYLPLPETGALRQFQSGTWERRHATLADI